MQKYEGIYVFKEPIEYDLLKFSFEHLNCDCIYEQVDSDMNNSVVKIYAYAEKPNYNAKLRSYLREYFRGINNKAAVRIMRGIDKSEVNAIG